MPQARTNAFGLKRDKVGKMVRLLEEDDRFLPRCESGHQQSRSRSPSTYFDTVDSMNEEDCASSGSSTSALDQHHTSTAVQNIVIGSSDESGSEFDTGNKLVSDNHGFFRASEWENSQVSLPVDEFNGNRIDDLIMESGVSSRSRCTSKHDSSWRDRYMVQTPRLHDSVAKNVMDGHSHRVAAAYQTQKAYRKGSSSKAPQTNDLTAPLLLEKKSRPISYKALQGESEDHVLINMGALGSKIRNTSGRRTSNSSTSGMEGFSKRKGNSDAFNGRHIKSDGMGAGRRDTSSNGAGSSRRGLSNLVCSSAADVLPSVSSSTLSNLACSSAVDVLPSVPSTLTGSSYLRSRRSSRSLGLDGETSRRPQALKQRGEEAEVLGTREFQNGADQAPYGSDQGPRQPGLEPYSHPSQPEPSRTDFVSSENPVTSSTSPVPFLPANRRLWRRNGALSRTGEGLRPFYRSNNSFLEANSPFGQEFAGEWSSRRRSLYGSRTDPMHPDSRSFNRNFPQGRPSSNTLSIFREMHHPQSRFPGPPARPPPVPPVAGFAEPSPLENGLNSSPPARNADYSYSSQPSEFVLPSSNTDQPSTMLGESGSMNRTVSNGENRPRLTVEGLSEILSALEYIERDEDLSYEQILMLEATILLGGIGLHDRYRDMRIDIDNMSYEELLALEERIGNVNTGLNEELVKKTLRVEIFTSPEVSYNYVPQEIEIKCSICQEEFEESAELGVLDCGHSHHITCIKQWLLQKNQCPICKAPAVP